MPQAGPCHSIQGTAYIMMTAAIMLGLLRAYRGTHRLFEPSPCNYFLTEKFSFGDLARGDGAVADALAKYDFIVRAVPWAAVHDRLPYHNDPNRHARSTLLPYQVGTVADRRCHYVRVVNRAFQNPGFSAESGIYPDISGYIRWNHLAIQCESKTEDTAGKLTSCSVSS